VSEIDILIQVPPIVVLTECKYLSPFREEQIIRYLDLAAYHHYSYDCQNVYLLLISNDPQEPAQLTRHRNPREIEEKLTKIRPHVDYKKVSAALAKNIGWISWGILLRMLDDLPVDRLPHSEGKIIQELILYISHKLRLEKL
jgi:hypothetical protein